MVTYAMVHYLHLLIDIRCPHIDPMFFLHHAVRPMVGSIEMVANLFVAQMIDKVWYDWQNRDPSNKNAFAGGSVSWPLGSSYTEYPTGGPPFLNVRGNYQIDPWWCVLTSYRRVLRSPAMACGRKLRLATFWIRSEGNFAMFTNERPHLPFALVKFFSLGRS